MVKTRTSLLASALAAVALLATAAAASATTYCVDKPSCVTAGGTNSGNGAAGFQSALTSAAGSGSTPDRIELGPTTYSAATGFSYTGGVGSNTVDIIGSGTGQTSVTATNSNTTALFVNSPGSTVSALRVDVGPGPSTGLYLSGTALAHDVAVVAGATTSGSAEGVKLNNGAVLDGSTVDVGSGVLLYDVATSTGAGTVQGSTVTGGAYGIYGPTNIHRVTVTGAGYGIYANGQASYKIDQALIVVPMNGKGIITSTTTTTDVTATVDHSTIVGATTASTEGLTATATHGGAVAHNAKLVARGVIVRGVTHSAAVDSSHGDATVEVDHSDLDLATKRLNINSGNTGAVTDKGGNVFVDPLFAGPSDYHLLAGSPVIDKAAAALQPFEAAGDRDAAPRVVDGDGDGTAISDMGAYEYQPPPPASNPGSRGTSGASTTPTDGGVTQIPPIVDQTPPILQTPPKQAKKKAKKCKKVKRRVHGKVVKRKVCKKAKRKHRAHTS